MVLETHYKQRASFISIRSIAHAVKGIRINQLVSLLSAQTMAQSLRQPVQALMEAMQGDAGRCRVKTRTIEEAMVTQGLPLDHWSDSSPPSYLR